MDQFKAHEEKMKAFREAKKNGKPPISGQPAPDNVDVRHQSNGPQ
jgi:hypothetical protein